MPPTFALWRRPSAAVPLTSKGSLGTVCVRLPAEIHPQGNILSDAFTLRPSRSRGTGTTSILTHVRTGRVVFDAILVGAAAEPAALAVGHRENAHLLAAAVFFNLALVATHLRTSAQNVALVLRFRGRWGWRGGRWARSDHYSVVVNAKRVMAALEVEEALLSPPRAPGVLDLRTGASQLGFRARANDLELRRDARVRLGENLPPTIRQKVRSPSKEGSSHSHGRSSSRWIRCGQRSCLC